MTFQDLHLIEPLLRAISEKGYETPTPIQQQAIAPALAGRDLLGCAQTGTGKTAAFTLPILQLLSAEPPVKGRRPIRALVLTPTRELAIQIDECCRDYACHLPLRHCVIFGGVNQNPQVDALRQGVDLLVATPGRLLDLIGQGYVSLSSIRFFVLDEADRMLDMGFIHDIRRILPLLPQRKQTLFFSATMPDSIARLADSLLHDPTKVTVTPPASVVDTISQQILFVEKVDKNARLTELLQPASVGPALVFTRTKYGADKVARVLNRAGIAAAAIHGNKSQNARQKAMADFRAGALRALIATDIAARGIDIEELPLVVNFELPEVPETYVHRIGRTGRAGHEGQAVSFCSTEERPLLAQIEKLIGRRLTRETLVAAPIVEQKAPVKPAAPKNSQPSRQPHPQENTSSDQPHRRRPNRRRRPVATGAENTPQPQKKIQKQDQKPAQKPAQNNGQKSTHNPSDSFARNTSRKPSQRPSQKPSQKPSQRPSQKPARKAAQQPVQSAKTEQHEGWLSRLRRKIDRR